MIKYPEFDNKTPEELKKNLEDLRNTLADIEDERELVLGQEGHHIQSAVYADKFDVEAETAQGKIDYIESLLAEPVG